MKKNIVYESRDGGPMYLETKLDRFPVELWGTVSNFIFLLIIIYWVRKTRLNFHKYPLITVAMPILLVGFTAGTIYHATRSHYLWLLLDFVPILILILTAAVYFWQLTFNCWWKTFLFTLGPVFLYRLVTALLPFNDKVYISIGYTVLALTVTVPAFCHCLLRNRKSWKWLVLAAVSFVIAILSHQADTMLYAQYVASEGQAALPGLLPMGTHFLWHLFGGISTFFLIQYLYETNNLDHQREMAKCN